VDLAEFYKTDAEAEKLRMVAPLLKHRGTASQGHLEPDLYEGLKDFPPLGRGNQPPLAIGCPGRLHRSIDVGGPRGLKLSHHIVNIGRIVIEKSLAGLRIHPLAANEVLVNPGRHMHILG